MTDILEEELIRTLKREWEMLGDLHFEWSKRWVYLTGWQLPPPDYRINGMHKKSTLAFIDSELERLTTRITQIESLLYKHDVKVADEAACKAQG